MLQELIKFRNLADSLTEFDSFLVNLFAKFNKRQFILKSLFHLFNAQNHANPIQNDLVQIQQMVTSIIKSRDKNHSELNLVKSQNEAITISNLSSDIIGFCASYLYLDEFYSFQNCSRHIYVSCNNPNTLQVIPSGNFSQNYENIHHLLAPQFLQLLKHQKVTEFEINVKQYMDMPSLHKMQFSSKITKLALLEPNQNSLKDFIHLAQCNFSKITDLKLHFYDIKWGSDLTQDIQKYVDSFSQLLMTFSNIKYLDLKELAFIDVPEMYEKLVSKLEDEEFRSKIFNQLEGFCFHGHETVETRFYNKLLHYFSDRLMTLHFDAILAAPINGLPKLREFCMRGANVMMMNNVIQTATNLEKIHLSVVAADMNTLDQDNKKRFERSLVELLNKKGLNNIFIGVETHFDIILSALTKMDLRDRQEMRFMFAIKQGSNKVMAYINTLEAKLKMSCNDYVLEVKFGSTEPTLDLKKKIKSGDKLNYNALKESNLMHIVWTNDGCKLNGYRARWLYPCSYNS